MEHMEKDIVKIFEDEDILVLDKPSGLVVNRSITSKSETLQDLLEKDYSFESSEVSEEILDDFSERSGIVHRLDKDTSGVLVVAKNKGAFNKLISQFKERIAVKEYLGVLCGRIDDEIIEIDAPLKRNPKSPLKFAVVEGGKDAFTRFEKIKSLNLDGKDYTLMKIFPKTGRTHQIRVHSAAMGHSIAGDSIYCSIGLLETSLNHFGRLMLHAEKLSFFHPKTGIFMDFVSQVPAGFSL
jgi:23S rRNA pseudouridine1911/1915/1917 synthase